MLPSVSIQKKDGQTGVAKPSATGICVIIGASEKGTIAQLNTFTKKGAAYAEFGDGPLVEYGAHMIDVTGKQTLLMRGAGSVVGAYGTPVYTNAGTSVITPNTATLRPFDDYDVLLTIVAGGTRGVAGVTYRYSLDGGITQSPVQALGLATSITIPQSGVILDLGAGTLPAGSTMAVKATGPQLNNADLATCLEALRISRAQFEGILIAGTTDATMLATLQTWITAREAEGRFYHAYVNTRYKTAAETEAQYRTALEGIYNASAAPSVIVGADGGRVPGSLPNGRSYVRPVALACAARAMNVDIKTMPSLKKDGAIAGWSITNDREEPVFHDENAFPGLGDSRFTTFRSFNGSNGVYITLPLLFSGAGSDYVFLPHVRVMNETARLAHQALELELSSDARKSSDAQILEEDAQRIETAVNQPIRGNIVTPQRVSDAGFVLARDDDASSNAGVVLTGEVFIVSLIYITGFVIEAKYMSKSIAVAA